MKATFDCLLSQYFRVFLLAAITLAVSGMVSAQFPGEVLYSFDDPGDGTSINDSISGNTHGTLAGGAIFDFVDAPILQSGVTNDSFADFSDGFGLMNGAGQVGVPFVFHASAVGGAVGDASLEWLARVPPGHQHSSFFWTNFDDAADQNRFNMFYNLGHANKPDDTDDRSWGGDFKGPAGGAIDISVLSIGQSPNVTDNPLAVGVWNQHAYVRIDIGGGGFEYQGYMNGVALDGHRATVSGAGHPTAMSWAICGRQAEHSMAAQIDEVRLLNRALDPEEMNLLEATVCPESGEPEFADTVCDSLISAPPAGFPDPPPAGLFTFTATAEDATGNGIFYSFEVTNGVDTLTQYGTDSTVEFGLSEGTWTATVTVDDSFSCADESASNFCELDLEVGPTPSFQGRVHLRFEDGVGTDIFDSESSRVVGQLQGAATFVDDTVAVDGLESNNFAVDFEDGFGNVTGVPFIFHQQGVEGDATMEWLMKAPAGHAHSSVFWTNNDNGNDDNRFNFFYNNAGHGGGVDHVGSDYRCLGCPTENNYGSSNPIAVDAWVPIALVRTESAPGVYHWEWYFNAVLVESQTGETTTTLPSATTWQIAGRSGRAHMGFNGLIDEVKFSDEALVPEEMQSVSKNCPGNGDTNCLSISMDPPPGNPAPPTGTFNVVVAALDGSGDPIRYFFVAENSLGERLSVGPQSSNETTFFLTEDAWTITVTVDDDPFCDDEENVTCEVDIDVGPSPPFGGSALLRFEEEAAGGIVDDVTGFGVGSFEGGSGVSPEAVPLSSGAPNLGCADFTSGFGRIHRIPFAFHDVPGEDGQVTGGDASLEFLIYPVFQGHVSIFWTNGVDNADDNRFNFFFNSGPTDGKIGADYRYSSGGVPANPFIGPIQGALRYPTDGWSHLAVNRSVLDDTNYLWEWYINGVINEGQTTTTERAMPQANQWLIAGRQNLPSFRGFIDEIRIESGRILDPSEMNTVQIECPAPGDDEFEDTTCFGIAITPDPEKSTPTAGKFSFTTSAIDRSANFVTYQVTLDNGIDPPQQSLTTQNTTSFVLGEGTWTVTSVVDDNAFCEDDASNATCSETFEVGPVEPFPNSVWLRFEEGPALLDSSSNQVVGWLAGEAVINTDDTPNGTISATGDSNNGSLDTTNGGFARVTGAPFVFNSHTVGGADGDATLEFFMKVPASHNHATVFWSNADETVDENRVHVWFNLSTLENDALIGGDFHTEGGPGELMGLPSAGENPLFVGDWQHVAIVRELVSGEEGGGAGVPGEEMFNWTWYIDGFESEAHSSTTGTDMPNSIEWLILGRQGVHSLGALLDEVRMSRGALTTNQFLTGDRQAVGGFRRGDCDQSGTLDFNDAIFHLRFLFLGENEDIVNTCRDACDSDDSGADDFTDDINSLRVLFLGQGEIPEPGPQPDESHPCGPDPTLETPEELTCESYAPTIACP